MPEKTNSKADRARRASEPALPTQAPLRQPWRRASLASGEIPSTSTTMSHSMEPARQLTELLDDYANLMGEAFEMLNESEATTRALTPEQIEAREEFMRALAIGVFDVEEWLHE